MAAQPPSAAPGRSELLRQGPLPGARENPRLQGEATVVVPAPADTRHGPPAAWGPRASGNRPGAQWGPGMKVTRCWPEPLNSVAAHRERQRARTAAHFQGDTAPRRDERVTLRQCGDAPLCLPPTRLAPRSPPCRARRRQWLHSRRSSEGSRGSEQPARDRGGGRPRRGTVTQPSSPAGSTDEHRASRYPGRAKPVSST